MKIETKKIAEFLKKINMNATNAIEEAVFNFEETGLKVSGVASSKAIRVDGILKKSTFSEYEAIGKIGVQDIKKLIQIIKSFGKEITIKVDGNLLTLKETGKKVETELVDIQFIQEVSELKELEFDEIFTVNMTKLNNFIADASINKDVIYTIRTAEKVVRFENNGKYKFHYDLEALEAKGGVKVSFGEPFSDAIMSLTGQAQLSLKNDFPCKVFEKTEDSIVTFVVAPRIDDEDEESGSDTE